jgi:hypothetical protein
MVGLQTGVGTQHSAFVHEVALRHLLSLAVELKWLSGPQLYVAHVGLARQHKREVQRPLGHLIGLTFENFLWLPMGHTKLVLSQLLASSQGQSMPSSSSRTRAMVIWAVALLPLHGTSTTATAPPQGGL